MASKSTLWREMDMPALDWVAVRKAVFLSL